MKRITFLIMFCMVAGAAMAQYDQKALDILDAMSAKYKKIPSYSAKFSSSLINETDGINEEFTGKIVVKGEKYMLEMEEQVVINNGTTVWTYLPDANEVNIDNYDPDEDEITPSKIYDVYKSGYKYILLGSEMIGSVSHSVIDLVPNDRDSQFFKIKLYISEKDSSLKNWTMFDRSGSKYKYAIKDFNTDGAYKDSMFTFDASKYPGVEIVDLR